MKTNFNPFLDPAPHEIRLPDSPLVRVIAQVQFSTQLGLVERPVISEIQKAIHEDFPVLDEQNLQSFVFDLAQGENGGKFKSQASPEPQWRFSHPESGFILQINASSITLETSRYTSRADFFRRFQVCLSEIHKHTGIPFVNRLGVRYVDRVPDSRCPRIHTMLCSPFQGLSGLPFGAQALADMHDFMIPVAPENGVLHGRTGFLPKGATIDPAVLPLIEERCWVLDLDLFRQSPPLLPFNPDRLAEDASAFALRIYGVFRWFVNDEFLRTFGGDI